MGKDRPIYGQAVWGLPGWRSQSFSHTHRCAAYSYDKGTHSTRSMEDGTRVAHVYAYYAHTHNDTPLYTCTTCKHIYPIMLHRPSHHLRCAGCCMQCNPVRPRALSGARGVAHNVPRPRCGTLPSPGPPSAVATRCRSRTICASAVSSVPTVSVSLSQRPRRRRNEGQAADR